MSLTEIWNLPLYTYGDGHVLTVGLMLIALAVFIAGFVMSGILSRLLGRRLLKSGLEADATNIIQRLVFFFGLVVTVVSTLELLHISFTHLTLISGALAVGLGFGAQAIINNFISGWILMSERQVRIGDYIELDGARGTVKRIATRSTLIRRTDGIDVLVPNSMLLDKVLVNWTLEDRNVRTSVSVGVAYGSPVRQVEKLLYQALAEHGRVLKEPAPLVAFENFGESSLLFEMHFWVQIGGAERELRLVRSDLRFRIDELFHEHGIVVAYPQRDIHLTTASPIDVRVSHNA